MKHVDHTLIKLLTFPNQIQWIEALKNDFLACVNKAISARGVAHIALSGGSTPGPFYEAISQDPRLPAQIAWWLGDERWVPADHPDSNEKMIRKMMGQDTNNWTAFQSWHQAESAEECAKAYEALLRSKIGTPPSFDLCLLGIGTDGHTASLFPKTNALNIQDQYAVVNHVPQMEATRLTVTYPTLNSARAIWFLVKGAEKAAIVERLIARDPSLPSALIEAEGQIIYWAR